MGSSSVDKAIDLLFHLHEGPGSRGVTELGRALGVPKSSAHRLLVTLARRGLVEREPSGRYRPGAGLIALGLGALDRDPIVALARPELEAEAAALGETVFLTAARSGQVVVLDKAEGTGFLRAAPRVGQAVPIHATAAGRLYLAFAPEAVRLEPDLPAFTVRTPRSPEALSAAVARARERGYDENRGEWIAGLAVLAAPVLASGRMVAALALAAPESRLSDHASEAVARRLVAAARRVGARLRTGGGGADPEGGMGR